MMNSRVSNNARGIQRDLGIFLLTISGQRKANSWITGLRDTANRIEGMLIVFDNDSSIAQGGTISPLEKNTTTEKSAATIQARMKHPRKSFHFFLKRPQFSFDKPSISHNSANLSPHILLLRLLFIIYS